MFIFLFLTDMLLGLRPKVSASHVRFSRTRVHTVIAVSLLLALLPAARAQTLGSSGTISGSVVDPSGAIVPGATVEIQNPVSGYRRSTAKDGSGHFQFTNVPFNPYHLGVTAAGF